MTIDGSQTVARFPAGSEPTAVALDPEVTTLARVGRFVRVPD